MVDALKEEQGERKNIRKRLVVQDEKQKQRIDSLLESVESMLEKVERQTMDFELLKTRVEQEKENSSEAAEQQGLFVNSKFSCVSNRLIRTQPKSSRDSSTRNFSHTSDRTSDHRRPETCESLSLST